MKRRRWYLLGALVLAAAAFVIWRRRAPEPAPAQHAAGSTPPAPLEGESIGGGSAVPKVTEVRPNAPQPNVPTPKTKPTQPPEEPPPQRGIQGRGSLPLAAYGLPAGPHPERV